MAVELKPVRPPIAIQRAYNKKLKAFIKEMDRSLFWWLRARYRQVDNQLIQVQDSAFSDLVKELRRLEREWLKKSNAFATETANWFSKKIQGYTAMTLQTEMKKRDFVRLGFDLKFKYHSVKERAVFKSMVTQNVNLIKSIASEHLTQVTGVVLRGIESGHDLNRMTEALKKSFGVTERRAAMIARDQTNKSTQNLSRLRTMELLRQNGCTPARAKPTEILMWKWMGKYTTLKRAVMTPTTAILFSRGNWSTAIVVVSR